MRAVNPVLRARSGDDALRIAERQQPAVIQLNLSLTGMPGAELHRFLKRHSETVHVPVFAAVITGCWTTAPSAG